MDGEVTLRLRSKSRTHPQWEAWSATLKWRDLFGSIGPHLFSGPDDDWVRLAVTAAAVRSAGREAFRHELEDDDFQSVKMHLRALRLIALAPAQTPRGRRKLIWSLTRLGEQVLLELRAAHAASAHPDQHASERSAGAGPGPAAPDSGPLPIRLRGGEADVVQTV
jgi:hypothetical protein